MDLPGGVMTAMQDLGFAMVKTTVFGGAVPILVIIGLAEMSDVLGQMMLAFAEQLRKDMVSDGSGNNLPSGPPPGAS